MIIHENDTAQRARVEECRPSRVHYAAASVASVASVASAAIGDARASADARREGIFADARDGRERAPNAAVCGTIVRSDG